MQDHIFLIPDKTVIKFILPLGNDDVYIDFILIILYIYIHIYKQ